MEPPKLLLPPRYTLSSEFNDSRKFFLAGPIEGGRNWQREAALTLWDKIPDCVVIDPSTDADTGPYTTDVMFCGKLNSALYPNSQIDWEKDYMHMTGMKRGLIFWLENESFDQPKDRSNGVYAQNTRVEIGRCIERARYVSNFSFEIGFNPAYHSKTHFGGIHFLEEHLKDCDKGLIRANSVSAFIKAIL